MGSNLSKNGPLQAGRWHTGLSNVRGAPLIAAATHIANNYLVHNALFLDPGPHSGRRLPKHLRKFPPITPVILSTDQPRVSMAPTSQ